MKHLILLLILAIVFIPAAHAFDVDYRTKVLLHFDNATVPGYVINDSTVNRTWTREGAVLPITATNSTKFGVSSMFNTYGTNGAIYSGNNKDFDMGTQNFTIDTWACSTYTVNYATLFGVENAASSTGYAMDYGLNGQIRVRGNWSGTYGLMLQADTAHIITNNTWNHIAIVRMNNNLYLYVNGTRAAVAVGASGYNVSSWGERFCIGCPGNVGIAGSRYWGWMDEFRVTKGVARWTANFTPPTTAYNYSFWNYTTPGTYYWTAPADADFITVNIQGGGGSGFAGGLTNIGNGGGASTFFNVSHIPVTPGQTYPITVGNGGQNAAINTQLSYMGTDSTAFGITAPGGLGGTKFSDDYCALTVAVAANGVSTNYLTTQWLSENSTSLGGRGYGAGGGGGSHYGTSPCVATAGGAGAPGIVRFWSDGILGENIPDFSAAPTTGTAGTTITFTDNSTIIDASMLTYTWDWGDGTAQSHSQEFQIKHIYAVPGSYSPSLTISNIYGTFTTRKENYILISGGNSQTWYSPNQVRFTILDWLGNNVVGATVSARYDESTLPSAVLWLSTVYGIDTSIAQSMLSSNVIMNGTSGDDGAVDFTMHSSLKYNITVVNGSTIQTVKLYPRESDYNIWLTAPTVNNSYAQTEYNLTFWEPNNTYFTMGAVYQDNSSHTQRVTFYVNATNGTLINYTTVINPGTAAINLTKTIPNIRGTQYYWGMKAVRTPTEGGNISMDRGVTAKGANGVLVDLNLPNTTYYPWIALFLLFMITSLASKANLRFMLILMVIMAAMFWWFGWLSGIYLTTVIPFAAILAALYYMKGSLRENYGIGGSGSMLVNIVVFLIIFQMMIGYIQGIGIFNQAAMANVQNQFSNVDLTTIQNSTSNFGGINDPLQSANAYAAIGWATVKILFSMIAAVFVIGIYLTEMFPYLPPAFFAIIQAGIWIIYVLFIARAAGKLGSEIDL